MWRVGVNKMRYSLLLRSKYLLIFADYSLLAKSRYPLIFVISLVFMIPNLLNANYGLLDDPTLLLSPPMKAFGYNVGSFIYSNFIHLFGLHSPFLSYLMLFLVLCALNSLIYQITWLITEKQNAGFLAILFFLLSPGTVEITATTFKMEAFLALLLLLVTCMWIRIDIHYVHEKKNFLLIYVLLLFADLLAYFTKETAVILVPYSFVIIMVILFSNHYFGIEKPIRRIRIGGAVSFFLYNVIIVICRQIVLNYGNLANRGKYAELYQITFQRMKQSFVDYGILLIPFIAFSIILISYRILDLFSRSCNKSLNMKNTYEFIIIALSALYFVVLLPWIWPSPYYINPAMAFVSILSAIGIYSVQGEKIKYKILFLILFVPIFVFNLFFSLNNYSSEIYVRKQTDAIDMQLVDYIRKLPKNEKILIGWTNTVEPVYQLNRLKELYIRDDLEIKGYAQNEQEVFDRKTLEKYDKVILSTAKNVYFNRIVWNDGLALNDTLKEICPQITTKASFAYKTRRLMFGEHDNLPYYTLGFPKIKEIKKGWHVYEANDILDCFHNVSFQKVIAEPLLSVFTSGLYPGAGWTHGVFNIRLPREANNVTTLKLSTGGTRLNLKYPLNLTAKINGFEMPFITKGKDIFIDLSKLHGKAFQDISFVVNEFVPKNLNINNDTNSYGLDLVSIEFSP